MRLVGHKTESIYRHQASVAERDLAEGVAKLAALREQQPAGARTVLPCKTGTTPAQSAAAEG